MQRRASRRVPSLSSGRWRHKVVALRSCSQYYPATNEIHWDNIHLISLVRGWFKCNTVKWNKYRTALEKLSCRPKTMLSSRPINQFAAYVFCATHNDSPPRLKNNNEKILSWAFDRLKIKISFQKVTVTHPKTNLPTFINQYLSSRAPSANITLKGSIFRNLSFFSTWLIPF